MSLKAWLGDIIFSVIMIIISVIFFVMSGNIRERFPNPADIGPAAFPRLMLGFIIICAVLQIISALRLRQKLKASGEEGEKVAFENKTAKLSGVALVLLYGYLLPILGYFITTPVAVFGMMYIMGNRKWIQMIAVTAGFNIIVYLIFVMFLRVSLP